MAEKQGLSVRELLESVYNALKDGGREIKLPSKAMAASKQLKVTRA